MSQTSFNKRVEPFPPSAISYLRTQFRCGLSKAVSSEIEPAQALLIFSLTYGAGARPIELAKMRIEHLIGVDGGPADKVRFDSSVTKHGTSRRVLMHADVRNDLLAFRHFFPDEEHVAFVPPTKRRPGRTHLPASALMLWFRACLKEAGLNGYSINSGRKTFLETQREEE